MEQKYISKDRPSNRADTPLPNGRFRLKEHADANAAVVLSGTANTRVEGVEADVGTPAAASENLHPAAIHKRPGRIAGTGRTPLSAKVKGRRQALVEHSRPEFAVTPKPRFPGDKTSAAVKAEGSGLARGTCRADRRRSLAGVIGCEVGEGNHEPPSPHRDAKTGCGQSLFVRAADRSEPLNRDESLDGGQSERPSGTAIDLDRSIFIRGGLAWLALRQNGDREANQRQHGRKCFVHYPFCRTTPGSRKRFDVHGSAGAAPALRGRMIRLAIREGAW